MLRYDLTGKHLYLQDKKGLNDARDLGLIAFAWFWSELKKQDIIEEHLTHEVINKVSVLTRSTILLNNNNDLVASYNFFMEAGLNYLGFCDHFEIPVCRHPEGIHKGEFSFTMETSICLFAVYWMKTYWLAKQYAAQRFTTTSYESQASLCNWMKTGIKLQNPFVETVDSFRKEDESPYNPYIYSFLTVMPYNPVKLTEAVVLSKERWYSKIVGDVDFSELSMLKVQDIPSVDWINHGVY